MLYGAVKSEIEIIDNEPYVRVDLPLTDHPIMVIRRWPLPSAKCRVQHGDPVLDYMNDCVLVRSSQPPWEGSVWFRLPQGGQTEAEMEEQEIPRPKSKLPVRWKDGRWERLLKSGWKPFPNRKK